jgi:hypothetical protein
MTEVIVGRQQRNLKRKRRKQAASVIFDESVSDSHSNDLEELRRLWEDAS